MTAVRAKMPWRLYLALGAVILGGLLWFQTPSGRGDDNESIVMVVSWSPEFRKQGVDVRWSLNNVDLPHETKQRSPWDKTIVVANGATLVLSGTQYTPGRLTCVIFKVGMFGRLFEVREPSTRYDEGSVRCYYP